MAGSAFEYGLLGVALLLGFFCFLIGLDKMVKLVLGSTILIVIILGLSSLFSVFNYFLIGVGPNWDFLGIIQPMRLTIIHSIDTTLNIVVFVGGMIVLLHYSHLDITLGSLSLSHQGQQLLLVPLAIISIMVGIAVAVLGVDGINPAHMATLASTLTSSIDASWAVRLLPLWILLQGLMSLGLIASAGFSRFEE